MTFNPEAANEFERRHIAFEEQSIHMDGTETNQQLPSWLKLIPDHGLKLRTDMATQDGDEPEILVLSGKEDAFRHLLSDPHYSWVAALEFMLDGKKYETYMMNLDFETGEDGEGSARAYLEIQEIEGHPWMNPKVTGGRKVRVSQDQDSLVSVARITNGPGPDEHESSFLIRIYLEYADS